MSATNVSEMDHAIELESAGVVAAGAAAAFVCRTVFLAEVVEPAPEDPVVHQVLQMVAAALVAVVVGVVVASVYR